MDIYTSRSPSSLKYFLKTLILILFISPVRPVSTSKQSQIYTNFIKKSCNIATYPPLCLKSLTPYAPVVQTSRLKMSNAALMVAISEARKCSKTVSKLVNKSGLTRFEAGSIKDCVGDLKDGVDELKRTVGAMASLRGADRDFQWDNAKTWASAAITDAESCLDGVFEGRVDPILRNRVRGCVSGVEKHVSNALALINHLWS